MIYLATVARRINGRFVGLSGYAVEADSEDEVAAVLAPKLPAGCEVINTTEAPAEIAPYLGNLVIKAGAA